MDTEDYHRRIDQISRENANLVETVRQLRDALEDANARRLDDQAVAEARKEHEDLRNRDTVSAIRDVLDRDREEHTDLLASVRLNTTKLSISLRTWSRRFVT